MGYKENCVIKFKYIYVPYVAFPGMDGGIGLELSWMTVFQVFMFSLSLSTGLEPELAPLSPYTLVVANLNALFAQLILAFLSAAGTRYSMYLISYTHLCRTDVLFFHYLSNYLRLFQVLN